MTIDLVRSVSDGCVALVAPRERELVAGGARRGANDAQPRFLTGTEMSTAHMAAMWRPGTGTTDRGLQTAANRPASQHRHQDGRVATNGFTYVAINKHFSIRSGPSTDRPPA